MKFTLGNKINDDVKVEENTKIPEMTEMTKMIEIMNNNVTGIIKITNFYRI